MNIDDYRKGFMDGMNVNVKYPETLMLMGYNLEQLIEIVQNHNIRKSDDREKFRKELADAGFAGFTVFSSPILKAYDNVHYPELRK